MRRRCIRVPTGRTISVLVLVWWLLCVPSRPSKRVEMSRLGARSDGVSTRRTSSLHREGQATHLAFLRACFRPAQSSNPRDEKRTGERASAAASTRDSHND